MCRPTDQYLEQTLRITYGVYETYNARYVSILLNRTEPQTKIYVCNPSAVSALGPFAGRVAATFSTNDFFLDQLLSAVFSQAIFIKTRNTGHLCM